MKIRPFKRMFLSSLKFLFMFPFRMRTICCEKWDYKYESTSRVKSAEWNNTYIKFIPFLTTMTVAVANRMRTVCILDSKHELLF